jgi:cyanophycinase
MGIKAWKMPSHRLLLLPFALLFMNKTNIVLMAIGGGTLSEAPEIIEEYLGLLSQKRAPKIIVMTAATNYPEEVGAEYIDLFGKHGVKNADYVDVSLREDAFDEKAIAKVCRADSLFFSGGDQLHITSLLGGTPLYDAIQNRRDKGFVIAGTSAGAAMMPNTMILTGDSNECPRNGSIQFAPGLSLVFDAIIDTHFSQRGRHGRLLSAVAHYPQELGIGLDEKTGIILRGNEFRVVGEGAATVMDGTYMKHTNLPYTKPGEPIGIFDIKIHSLPRGYKFDLKTRRPSEAHRKHA